MVELAQSQTIYSHLNRKAKRPACFEGNVHVATLVAIEKNTSTSTVDFASEVRGNVLAFNKAIDGFAQPLFSTGCADDIIKEAVADACTAKVLAFRVKLEGRPSGGAYHPLSIENDTFFVDFYSDAVGSNVESVVDQARGHPRKKSIPRGDPPKFQGDAGEDVDMWIFGTENFYHQEFGADMMNPNSGTFVAMVSANLGPNAKAWYRELLTTCAAANRLVSRDIFEAELCARFKDRDHAFKTLTEMFDLQHAHCKNQEEYAAKF
ncbi:hypothetical protein ACHHYP_20426 [Achlya hypogyna]|uniref:Retrotransposon gag domain-containing protein n=1 Tax=Achlya hypogyna TaxID=1202772 RepID=A0A1V9ZIT8_ACHHY|nr:hypothetical protein ACHHYP_20426 [Achlya hypogyna]